MYVFSRGQQIEFIQPTDQEEKEDDDQEVSFHLIAK